MRYAIIFLLSLVLLFGCTGPRTEPLVPASSPPQMNATNLTNYSGPPIVPPNLSQAANLSPAATHYDFSNVYSDDGKLIVYSFYSSRCLVCKSIQPFMEELGRKYANKTDWRGFDINFQPYRDYYFQFFKEYNISQSRSGTPTVMVNGTILWGKYEINDSLENIINSSVR